MPKGIGADVSDGHKGCPTCQQRKPLDQFHKSKATVHGYGVYCKDCQRERHDKWRRKNLGYMAEQSKKWRLNNPRLSKDHSLRTVYGVPLGWYDATLEAQGGKCACCGAVDPGGRGDFHVDHCHTEGHVRGLLCHGCNVSLGHFQHDVSVLEMAIAYLNRTSR